MDFTDRIIEFLVAGRPRLALVTRQVGEKLQVTDTNGKQHRLSAKQVIVAHESASLSTLGDVAAKLEERIGAAQGDVDTELLWESGGDHGGGGDVDLAELAERYFGEPGSVERSAIFRAVLGDSVRFKVRGTTITARSRDQVEDRLTAIRAREERLAQRAAAVEWIREAIRSGDGTAEAPADMQWLIDRIEAFVRGREDEVGEWLAEASKKRAPRQLGFDLLVRVGRLSPDADQRLVMAGVREEFPERVMEELAALEPFSGGDSTRMDFSTLEAFSIDDEDTVEVDDALTVEDAGGRLRVGIHIADVAHFVPRDSALDREAIHRGATLYLPYRRVPMLPERLSCDLASLVAGELRPCVSVLVDFDDNGEIGEWSIRRGQLRVEHRLTYDGADRLIGSDDDGGLARSLRRLDEITARLEAARRADGALTVRRPELKITVDAAGEIELKLIDGSSASRRIVSELMILANSLAAALAATNGVPVIFRAQDPPSEPVTQPEDYDPVALDRLFRKLSRSRLSLEPNRHAGLAVDAYTQLTSPLRRFQDLVIQRQVAAHLAGESPPYEREELFDVLGSAEAVEGDNRALEGDANREFALRWVERNLGDDAREAIVITAIGGGYLVELTDPPIRGKLLAEGTLEDGERVSVEIRHVDPKQGSLLLDLAG